MQKRDGDSFPHAHTTLPEPDTLPVRGGHTDTALSAAYRKALARRVLKLGNAKRRKSLTLDVARTIIGV